MDRYIYIYVYNLLFKINANSILAQCCSLSHLGFSPLDEVLCSILHFQRHKSSLDVFVADLLCSNTVV